MSFSIGILLHMWQHELDKLFVWHVEQKSSSPGPKESSPSRRSGWPKGTMMERAIQDLEKGVAEYCPPRADGEEPEQPPQSGGKAKRLPREVKQKLAKVARLAVRCICTSF
jgi:hypothetical protein